MQPSKPQRQMDWEAVWKSLNWNDEERLERAERDRLQVRAEQYAAEKVDHRAELETAHPFLTFQLGNEQYGMDVRLVRGVRAAPHITRVPGVPDFYRGIINLRGQMISVLDLRRFFNVVVEDAAAPPGEVIIVHTSALFLALLANHVHGVVDLPSVAIKPVDNLPYALGVTNEHIVILNIIQLFEDERLSIGVRE